MNKLGIKKMDVISSFEEINECFLGIRIKGKEIKKH